MTAQAHWRKLATEKRKWAAHLASRGEYTGVHLRQAKQYEDTATAIDLSEKHGEPYCVCHLRPLKEMRASDRRNPRFTG